MSSEPKRELTAIMFIDMVGYTTMMQKDERKAQDLVKRQRELIKPLVIKDNGEVLRYIGDGTLCTFRSAIEAVNCAIDIQKVLRDEDELNLRIGIHVGDIVFEGDDIYGDGVNVASRIEPLAESGGICISARVRDDIKNQQGLSLNSLGKKDFKNVEEQIEVFTVTSATEPSPVKSDIQKPTSASSKICMKWIGVAVLITTLVVIGLKIDFGTMEVESYEELNNLRIAVLPFDNMSSDPENEFFADGITDDILAQLAKINSLEVISRTSIMQYKNTTKSLSEIGKELGVATILEGSVRRSGNRVRIIAQLIDARTDKHLWAETYDRDLDDIFAIQSDVAKKIAAALKASLTPEEEKRINKRPTDNLEAYDYYLKGNIIYSMRAHRKTGGINAQEAIAMYEKAIELDPGFGLAYSRLAISHLWNYYFRRTPELLVKAKEVLDKAIMLEPDSPETEMAQGYYYYRGLRDYDNALLHLESAIKAESNNSDLLFMIGSIKGRQGKLEEAAEYLQKSSDLDPQSFNKAHKLTVTYKRMQNWDEAIRAANRAILINPNYISSYYGKMWLELNLYGSLESVQSTYAEAKEVERSDPFSYDMWIFELNYLGHYDIALAEAKSDTTPFRPIFIAIVLDRMGDGEAARPYYEKSIEVFKNLSKSREFDVYQTMVSYSYGGLGQKEEAIEWGKMAMKTTPLSKDLLQGADVVERYAQMLTMIGEYDEAIEKLEQLLPIPSNVTIADLKFNKWYDPLREHPRFIKLIAN